MILAPRLHLRQLIPNCSSDDPTGASFLFHFLDQSDIDLFGSPLAFAVDGMTINPIRVHVDAMPYESLQSLLRNGLRHERDERMPQTIRRGF